MRELFASREAINRELHDCRNARHVDAELYRDALRALLELYGDTVPRAPVRFVPTMAAPLAEQIAAFHDTQGKGWVAYRRRQLADDLRRFADKITAHLTET